jgi:hypothetical protein
VSLITGFLEEAQKLLAAVTVATTVASLVNGLVAEQPGSRNGLILAPKAIECSRVSVPPDLDTEGVAHRDPVRVVPAPGADHLVDLGLQ